MKSRSPLSNHAARWTPESRAEFARVWNAGAPLAELSAAFRRTEKALAMQAYLMKLPPRPGVERRGRPPGRWRAGMARLHG